MPLTGIAPTAHRPNQQGFWPITLMLGLGVILASEILLFIDVSLRGWAVAPYEVLDPPTGALQSLGRWIAVNITPICWVGFLCTLDGLLTLENRRGREPNALRGSPVRKRPGRFVFCFLISVPLWLLFDWINFSFMDAWRYHGLPDSVLHRYLGYFFAFGSISPAMFLTAEFYQQLGLGRVRGKRVRINERAQIVLVGVGLVMVGFPFVVRDPVGCLTLWLGWFLLLDPINHRFGAPSILGDWRAGRWGRTLALLAGGATCGLLWEFWNYWAAAKWTYNLPFLGPLEMFRYFEMPLAGLLGFPPFAVECWVMFQTAVLVVERFGIGFREAHLGKENIL